VVHPDDEDKPFVARWNTLLRVLLVQPSVKLVARTVIDYGGIMDGCSVYPSAERLTRVTGLSDRTVRTAWGTLRGLELADRVIRSGWADSGKKRTSDLYNLEIPANWHGLPILGPAEAKFRCLTCHHLFNPRANSKLGKDGSVTFKVFEFTFCSSTGRDCCYRQWERQQAKDGKPVWGKRGDEWKLFRQARADDWAAFSQAVAA